MFDKREDEKLQELKESTKPKTQGVDVVTEGASVKRSTKSYSTAEEDTGEKFVAESYVSLLKNKLV